MSCHNYKGIASIEAQDELWDDVRVCLFHKITRTLLASYMFDPVAMIKQGELQHAIKL